MRSVHYNIVTSATYYSNSHFHILSHETAVPQQPRPQLHANDAEDKEDEEAQCQHIAQHWECVQEQCHQDTHTCQHTHMEKKENCWQPDSLAKMCSNRKRWLDGRNFLMRCAQKWSSAINWKANNQSSSTDNWPLLHSVEECSAASTSLCFQTWLLQTLSPSL